MQGIWILYYVALGLQANCTDDGLRLSAKLVPTLSGRGLSRGKRNGSPTAVNLSFLDRGRYFFFQVAPHLSSRGGVDSVPDPVLLREYGSA
jgi:hypothetical protein